MLGPMQAVQGVKEIAELVKKYNDVPLYEKIVALQDQVVEIATERLDLYTENQSLKQKLELRAKMHFRNPYWYEEGDEVPFCPTCYESSKGELRIHLPHPPQEWNGGNRRICKNKECRCTFYDEGVEPRTRQYSPTYKSEFS